MRWMLILPLWLWGLPALAGALPVMLLTGGEKKNFERREKMLLAWLTGQTLFWAMFQLVCVPLILREKTLSDVAAVFGGACAALSGIGGISLLVSLKKGKWSVERRRKAYAEKLLFAVFLLLLLLQLVQAVRLAYGDGDDAYYVAVSAIAQEGDTMYRKLAYTGGATELDIRHGLAPFPIWIAFLVRLSGLHTATLAHIGMPLFLIPMAYAVFYLIGKRLWREEPVKLWTFMVFTQLLVLFGNYSLYSAESFMIARSRQGKAALGSMIFPFMLYLLMLALERLKEGRRIGGALWLVLTSLVMGACLCSTLGALLSCMLIGVAGLCAAVSYRRPGILVPLAGACVPALVYAYLYIRLG